MEVSIIYSKENIDIAQKFINSIREINIIKEFTDDTPIPRTLLKRKMLISDVIILLIDEKFESNPYLNYASKIASVVAKEKLWVNTH